MKITVILICKTFLFQLERKFFVFRGRGNRSFRNDEVIKFAKKSRYFRLLPYLAHRKLLPREFWASRNDLSNFEKMSADACGVLLTSFAKNESLYRRISTKYKSSKLFWRILEDNKENRRENLGKKTVLNLACR